MYTIIVTDNNELSTTQRERIIQRSKMVDTLHFLVPPTYKSCDMSKFTCSMEYILPVSRELHNEILTASDELYKGYIEYKVPFDTGLTREAGKVEVKLTFICAEMDADGVIHQKVRKTTPAIINITACSSWCDIVPDAALSSLDQRIMVLTGLVQAIDEETQILMNEKADNIKYNAADNTLHLTSNGERVGDIVDLSELDDDAGDSEQYEWEYI